MAALQTQSNLEPQRMGLVLSGGGLKFAVHAGLFEYLEEQMYQPELATTSPAKPLIQKFDCVVGTSAGSIVAAAIACGYYAHDARLLSFLFAQPDFKKYILDLNTPGMLHYLLTGEPEYLKGLYQGKAIQRTLEVFFSHNFLEALGEIYCNFKLTKLEYANLYEDKFKDVLKGLEAQLIKKFSKRFRKLYKLRRETFGNAKITQGDDASKVLKLITFQDINPHPIGPYLEHYVAYEEALKKYHAGWEAFYGKYKELKSQAQRPSWFRVPEAPRPRLYIVGTDLVTGQNTIFANATKFSEQKKETTTATTFATNYYYIGDDEKLVPLLENDSEQQLRPRNYIYRELATGLPVAWAVRSSLSISGVFVPTEISYKQEFRQQSVERRDFFVDGGVTDNYALQVAGDPHIGNCDFILGGNIGNLGRRVHSFKSKNVLDVLQRTMLIMGDGNVDANASHE